MRPEAELVIYQLISGKSENFSRSFLRLLWLDFLNSSLFQLSIDIFNGAANAPKSVKRCALYELNET